MSKQPLSADSQSHEVVRYYEVDWEKEKFPEQERNLNNWKDLVSEKGKERIVKVIIEEIFKNLGS